MPQNNQLNLNSACGKSVSKSSLQVSKQQPISIQGSCIFTEPEPLAASAATNKGSGSSVQNVCKSKVIHSKSSSVVNGARGQSVSLDRNTTANGIRGGSRSAKPAQRATNQNKAQSINSASSSTTDKNVNSSGSRNSSIKK